MFFMMDFQLFRTNDGLKIWVAILEFRKCDFGSGTELSKDGVSESFDHRDEIYIIKSG